MKLRDYQNECLEAIEQVRPSEKALIQAPTGSGKTIILASLAANAKGRTLIVVPSTELREQSEEKLKMIDAELDIGHVQASLDDIHTKIVISTRQSLSHKKSNRIQRMLEHGKFEYLIYDEAHQAPKQLQKVLANVNEDIKTIAFTATPYTKECIELFGQPIFRRTILDMIDGGFLVEPYAIMVQSKTNISHVSTTNGDFAQGELERAINNTERNRLIVEAYKKYAFERKLTLLFAAGREHGKELLREFTTEGISCDYVDGETPSDKRKEIINNFKNKKIKVLINIMALTTGFDVPETDCVMICRPSQSRILYEQIIGRGLRLAEGKSDCLIVDIQDIVKRHNLMDVSTIFDTKIKHGETLRKARKRIEEEKKRQEEFERKRIEAEQQRQREMEIVAQRIKLFNRDLKLGFENRKLDWFRVDATTFALGYGLNQYYAIESDFDLITNKDRFNVFEVCTGKENKTVSYIIDKENVIEAIEYIEKLVKKNTYSDPNAQWKNDPPTENQLKFCGWAKTKWQVSKYFASSSISSIIKKHKIS